MANWLKVLTTYHLFYQPCWFECHLDYNTLFADGLIAFLKSHSFWKCNTFLISSNIVLIILKDHEIQIKILLNTFNEKTHECEVLYVWLTSYSKLKNNEAQDLMTHWSATCEARYTVRVPFPKLLFGIVLTDWETGSQSANA